MRCNKCNEIATMWVYTEYLCPKHAEEKLD